MMRLSIAFILFCILSEFSFGQEVTLGGQIKDGITGESLPGVNVFIEGGKGTVSDINGNYFFSLERGKYALRYRYIGYEEQQVAVELQSSRTLHIYLKPEVRELEQVVVSAGRFEQRLSDIPVSLELIKPSAIRNQGATSLETVLSKLPGVEVLDGQANIRGGSGWSYGAGSRAMLLLDGLPLLTPDAGDAKWNFLPLEIVEQVEVLKGASSVLYGSSALNGIIHFRTLEPGITPKTAIVFQTGMYMNPARPELKWWGKSNPLFSSVSLMHSRRYHQHDLTAGMYLFGDAGYRTDNHQKRARLNLKYRYRDKQIQGLSYGANANMMLLDNKDFFLWQNADSGAWMQNPLAVAQNNGIRANIDPFVVLITPEGEKHSIRTRLFATTNHFPTDKAKNNRAYLYHGEYQYSRKIRQVYLNTGITGNYSSSISNLFGNHHSNNAAVYAQLDYQKNRLLISAGFRYERFRLDTIIAESKPVYRAGLNYRISKSSFFRANYGMGFRFPSIAEKFTYTSVGGVTIFPSPKLGSETGWNAEAGFKQGLQIAGWNGFVDLAGFITGYRNMMEFMFGFYDTITFLPLDVLTQVPSLRNMGFQSQNVGMAQVSGFEAVISGQGKLGSVPLTLLIGYTYSLPVDLNKDTNYRKLKSDTNDYLKYRNIHSFKADIQLEYKRLQAGWSMIYNSFLLNVDAVFTDPFLGELIMPGYPAYRMNNRDGYIVHDLRIAYSFSSKGRLNLIMRNALNKEYIGRPGDIRPPRHIILQYSLSL